MGKRVFIMVLAFLIIFPNSLAWKWETHQNLVEKLYDDIPRELQTKLNISLMKEGSIAPDKDFHDNVLHHYPQSYELALEWVNKNGSFDEISYNFGVAAHYISDSFVAPHYISKEPYKLHDEFEGQAKKYIPKVKCYNYDIELKQGMENGSLNYKDWGEWLLTKDKKIPEKEADSAMMLIYSVAFDKFNFECNKKTKVEYIKEYFSYKLLFKLLAVLLLILFLYIFYRIIKRFKYRR